MTVTTDLVTTWRRPRAVLRQHLARGRSEAFAFTFLLVFLILAFIAQWPVAAREAYLAGEPTALPRILPRAYAVLATIPLWYGLAALGHLVARAFGGQGTWYAARLALFWALATVGPLMGGSRPTGTTTCGPIPASFCTASSRRRSACAPVRPRRHQHDADLPDPGGHRLDAVEVGPPD